LVVNFSLVSGRECLTLTPSLAEIPCECRYYIARNYILRATYLLQKVSVYLQPQWALKATEFGEIMQTTPPLRRSRSFKVTSFGTNRKLMRLPISD